MVELAIANLLVVPEISASTTASLRLHIGERDEQARDSNCNFFFCVGKVLGCLRPYSKLSTVIFGDGYEDMFAK